jgi:hypothetical protein
VVGWPFSSAKPATACSRRVRAVGEGEGVALDLVGEVEHGVGVAFEERALLRFEEVQEPAVVGEFFAETIRDEFPGGGSW